MPTASTIPSISIKDRLFFSYFGSSDISWASQVFGVTRTCTNTIKFSESLLTMDNDDADLLKCYQAYSGLEWCLFFLKNYS